MKISTFAACILALSASLSGAVPEGNYPSLPSEVFSTYIPRKPEAYTPEAMASAAVSFLKSLKQNLRRQAALPFDSPEKAKWTNVPPRGPQGGVRLGDLNEKQMKKACDLLAAVLSPQGYGKVRNIPLADDRLLRNGQRRPGFGAEDYWLAIFGEPSATGKWAIQFDGHHLAVNLTFHGKRMSMSPTFIGTQPREFKLGKDKVVPMAREAPAALALLKSLDDKQQKIARVGDRRRNIVTAAGKDGFIPTPVGLPGKSLNASQRTSLISLLGEYVGDLPEPFAQQRLKELSTEIDKMSFAWWGPAEKGGDVSYRLQGPSLIIEYAGQDLGGDPHNHLHSMYRDPTNEYGVRLAK